MALDRITYCSTIMSDEQRSNNNRGGGGRGEGKKRGKGGGWGNGRGEGGKNKGNNSSNGSNRKESKRGSNKCQANNNTRNKNSARNRKNDKDGVGNQGNRPPPSRQPRIPPVPNTKKNGEKGADAHTVSEKTRIRFTQVLMDFREDDTQTRCAFPTDLTNTERKFLHELALQLGLASKSTGKGKDRHITVTKRDNTVQQASARGVAEDLPLLRVGADGETALARHIKKFPPTETEQIESRETGSSLVAALRKQEPQQRERSSGDTTGVTQSDKILSALNGLGLGSGGATDHASQNIRDANVGKRVDTRSRRERHAFYQRKKQEQKDYKQILRNRSNLPAYNRQAEIVATVASSPVTIIQGGA